MLCALLGQHCSECDTNDDCVTGGNQCASDVPSIHSMSQPAVCERILEVNNTAIAQDHWTGSDPARR